MSARLIGVNSRNLKTLAVSLETALALGPTLGPGVVGVAESGIRSRADIDDLTAAGYHAFLVGERFMSQPDPGAALGELVGAAALGGSTASHRDGRGARRSRREE